MKKLKKTSTSPLVEDYLKMNKEQLLEVIEGLSLDLITMTERVDTFMEKCTINMSKSNYTIEVIEELIYNKQKELVDEFCFEFIDDEMEDEFILKEIKERAKSSQFYEKHNTILKIVRKQT